MGHEENMVLIGQRGKEDAPRSRNKVNESIDSGSTGHSEVTLETGVEYSIKEELQK